MEMDQLGWTQDMDGILSKVDRLLDEMLESGKWREYNCKEPEAPTSMGVLDTDCSQLVMWLG